MCLLNESLKSCIEFIRLTKYRSLDLITTALIDELYDLEGVTYYEDAKKDQIVFALPLSDKKTKVFYPKKYSFKRLVTHCKRESLGMHSKAFRRIISKLSRSEYSCD